MNVIMGVGDGTGNLYVEGEYEAIKTLQAKLEELRRLRRVEQLAKNFALAAKNEYACVQECSDASQDEMPNAIARLQAAKDNVEAAVNAIVGYYGEENG